MASKWPNQAPKLNFVEELPPITLLIPVRNEVQNLESLFREIKQIDYPGVQVLLVDDHSEDGSLPLMLEASDPRITILSNPGIGKKSAIEFGVEKASTELIFCSDADCRFPKYWLTTTAAAFADPKIQLVCGPVLSTDQDTFFQRFQRIEWASILLVTQYFFSQKQALICSAANLAYRKSAFLKVKGYDSNRELLSGDDEFLLKKVRTEFGKDSCVYLPFATNLVLTQPQLSISQLINQRVRWAGKWKAHGGGLHAFSAIGSVSIQVCWLASIVLLGMGILGILTFLTVWLGKILTEKGRLGRVLNALGFQVSLLDYVKTSFLHPVYVLTVAVGALRGKFDWKGRSN
jgi:biofilm PGA synthesis N-glycosyltransferase PgaC